MSVWDNYISYVENRGDTRRKVALRDEKRYINRKLPNNLSYQHVEIDGEERIAAIINSDNLNEKTIISMPDETLRHGALVHWMDNYWLLTDKDAGEVVYAKGKLLQCNYLLKWVDDDDVIREQWCVVDDGTKYLTGEFEDRHFIVSRGDTRLQMIIGRNEHTAKFGRNSRFLIDDPNVEEKLAYGLTKPLRIGFSYNNTDGIYKFVLQEIASTDEDNMELGIADYYKHFPRKDDGYIPDLIIRPEENVTDRGKEVWL